MKFFIAFIPLLWLSSLVSAQTDVSEKELPSTTVEWKETKFDFGEIGDQDSVSHTFYFKNTGENPLKIFIVQPSCGCTKGKYSTEDVLPGKKGFVEIKFSPHGKSGKVTKMVTVQMSTDPMFHTLNFEANIIPGK